ncbi:MAG: sigma-70 family RNA polymerase sigma factor [Candidatus Poribacteria bacterium]|nr:sigma-70 family RNA polymerase sigma factor [Candidatus Poribacteria bacterium]
MADTKYPTTLFTPTQLENIDDCEFVERVQNGDTEAFNPLVLKYQGKIYNLIYLRVQDRETARDLCQDVFLKAFQGLPRFRWDSTFYSWLYQIAVNCSIDFLRKRNRQSVLMFEALPIDTDSELPMAQTRPCPAEALESEELGRIIRQAIRRLSPGQRRVFRLRYRRELPIKEIALRLNRSEGTVKTHLYHAHRRLRSMLLPYLRNEPLEWMRES